MKKNAVEQYMLEDLVSFVQGINSARAEKQYGLVDIIYYDQASFEKDYNHEEDLGEEIPKALFNEHSLNEGDVIISNSFQQAAMIGKANAGKVPSINFTKVEFNKETIDKQYFIYLFNNYSLVKRQKERGVQGDTIPKIPLSSLKRLVVPVIPMTEQIKIGQIYTDTIKLQTKLNKYAKLIEQLTNNILEKTIEGEINHE